MNQNYESEKLLELEACVVVLLDQSQTQCMDNPFRTLTSLQIVLCPFWHLFAISQTIDK